MNRFQELYPSAYSILDVVGRSNILLSADIQDLLNELDSSLSGSSMDGFQDFVHSLYSYKIMQDIYGEGILGTSLLPQCYSSDIFVHDDYADLVVNRGVQYYVTTAEVLSDIVYISANSSTSNALGSIKDSMRSTIIALTNRLMFENLPIVGQALSKEDMGRYIYTELGWKNLCVANGLYVPPYV